MTQFHDTHGPLPVLCLAGPTAAGKSASVRALASRWPIDIINVDSATIYTGMDIGTAKPDQEERSQLRHHLLDIRDPAQAYSAAEFRQDALTLVERTRAAGRIPVLAGGTMLYFKALREGLDDLPQADPALRADLDRQAAERGWPALHADLRQLDPTTAERLAPNDSQRIQRALEICLLTGRPMSDLLTDPAQRPAADTRWQFVTISLEPSDRLVLHRRIAQRFGSMLTNGLIDEVSQLRQRPDLHPGLPSIRCVGYRQVWSYLAGEVSLHTAEEQAVAATRQLAKRQITWLRALPDRTIIDCLDPQAVARLIDAAAPILDSSA